MIKYFAWDRQFAKKIDKVREQELNAMASLWGSFIGLNVVGNGSGIVIAVCTFTVYSLVQGRHLNSATAFTAINLLRTMTHVVSTLPRLIMRFLQAKVSFDRIDEYLNERNLPKYELSLDTPFETTGDDFGFKNAEFCYHSQENTDTEVPKDVGFTLKNLNFKFPEGKLSLIAGPIGAGKSSLLSALLSEMQVLKGLVLLPKTDHTVDALTGLSTTVALGAQTPWLLNATIRENILFGQPFESARYEQVLKECALITDLESLEGGDLTEIGEKGINLSGGQKQRISLARACYSKAKLVLLDDILSAVDSPTAKYLLDKCILGLLKGRTVVLITHSIQLVGPFADFVVYMRNGEVLAADTPNNLRDQFEDLEIPNSSIDTLVTSELIQVESNPIAKLLGDGTTLVEKETKAIGSVRYEVYRSYLLSTGGYLFCCIFFGLNILQWFMQIGNDLWLKNWTDHNEQVANLISMLAKSAITFIVQKPTYMQSLSPQQDDTMYYVGVYGMLGIAVIFTSILTTVLMLYGQLRASRILHQRLLYRVLGAPLRFFETTPIGRILNRFSSDMENVDGSGLEIIMTFLYQIIGSCVTLILIGVVSPAFLLLAPFMLFAFAYVARMYRASSRELKRFTSITTSPVYAHFSETLNGLTTIRAYSAENRFIEICHELVNENHKSDFLLSALNRWLAIRMDLISSIAVFFSGISILFVDISAGLAAMIIAYSMDMTETLLWSVRFHAEMEISMNAGNWY